jgi:hypothetical protein
MPTLELKDITDYFIRKKLGLKKTEEHKYHESYVIRSFEDRPYHKRFDMTGGRCEISEEDGFENNENICNIFKSYFKEVSFGVYCYTGFGHYYIYPKYNKKNFEGFENIDKNDLKDFVNGDTHFFYYHKKGIPGMKTIEIIEDILINCYIIEKTIREVKKKTILDIKNIIYDKLESLT